jgi:hypothetical protein
MRIWMTDFQRLVGERVAVINFEKSEESIIAVIEAVIAIK